MQFSKNDYKLFEQLVALSQPQLHKLMSQFLEKKYKTVVTTEDYTYAIGDIPIALVAHMDTVFKFPVHDLYYDSNKYVFWSPDGLGADDRAGVFAILQILKTGLRPSIILTTDEEMGGMGASALVLDHPNCPISGLKYMIQLDRRGEDDAVFYDCITEDFQQYITNFGFSKALGSFSDISFLMPEWDICGVNLSIGYYDEHTYQEHLRVDHLYATIHKVINMLRAEEIPDFKFEEQPLARKFKTIFNKEVDSFGVKCHGCGLYFEDYETIPVKGQDGITKFYCPDCIASKVEWCHSCGEAYEITNIKDGLCKDCAEAKNE